MSDTTVGAVLDVATMRPGTRVEVRTSFDGSWVSGFEVESEEADGYRIRRLSDREVLPKLFPPEAVRRARSRETWWV
jgi:hypothetical protein